MSGGTPYRGERELAIRVRPDRLLHAIFDGKSGQPPSSSLSKVTLSSIFSIMTLKARVKNGRLIVDEPSDLPDGTEIELLPLDLGDWLIEEDRSALHRALAASDIDIKAGHVSDAKEVLRELRSK